MFRFGPQLRILSSYLRSLIVAGSVLSAIFSSFETQAQNKSSSSTSSQKETGVSNSSLVINKKNPLNINYLFALGGKQVQGEKTQATLGGAKVELEVLYAPTSWLGLSLIPVANFETGAQQSFSNSQSDQNNKVFLQKATADFKPFEGNTLSVGVQDLKENHHSLMFARKPFPGLRAKQSVSFDANQSVALEAETLVPTTSSLSTNTKELEKTPGFDSVGVSYQAQLNSRSRHLVRFNYFQFRDLPSSVAFQSGLNGNNVESISENESVFPNSFKGTEAAIKSKWIITKNIDLGGQFLYLNNQGTSRENQAFLYGGLADFYFDKKTKMGLEAASFRIEADATVAAFANSYYGYTNRNGYYFEANYELKDPALKVIGGWTETEVIYKSPSQQKENSFYLRIEVSNAAL